MFPLHSFRPYGPGGGRQPVLQTMFPSTLPHYVPQPHIPGPSSSLQPAVPLSATTIGAYDPVNSDSIVVPVVVPRSFSIPPPLPASFPTYAQYQAFTQEAAPQSYFEAHSQPSLKPHTLTADAPEFIPASHKQETSNSVSLISQKGTISEKSTAAVFAVGDSVKGPTYPQHQKERTKHERNHHQGEQYHPSSQGRRNQMEYHHQPSQRRYHQEEQFHPASQERHYQGERHFSSQAYDANQRHFEKKVIKPKADSKTVSSNRPPWSDVPADTPKAKVAPALPVTQSQAHLQCMPSIHSMDDSNPAQNIRKGLHEQNLVSEEKQNARQNHKPSLSNRPRGHSSDYFENPTDSYGNYYFQHGHNNQHYDHNSRNNNPEAHYQQFHNNLAFNAIHHSYARGRGNKFPNTNKPRTEFINSSLREGQPRHPHASYSYRNEYVDNRENRFTHGDETTFIHSSEQRRYSSDRENFSLMKFDEELHQYNYHKPIYPYQGRGSNNYKQSSRDYQPKGKFEVEFYKTRNPEIIRKVSGIEISDCTSSNSDVEIEYERTHLDEDLDKSNEPKNDDAQSGALSSDHPHSEISDFDPKPIKDCGDDPSEHLDNTLKKIAPANHQATTPSAKISPSGSPAEGPESTASETTEAPAQLDNVEKELCETIYDGNKENHSHFNAKAVDSTNGNNFNRPREEQARDRGVISFQRSNTDIIMSNDSQRLHPNFDVPKPQDKNYYADRSNRLGQSRGRHSEAAYRGRREDHYKDSGPRTSVNNAAGAERSNRGSRYERGGRGGRAGVWRSNSERSFDENTRASRVFTPSNKVGEVDENLEEKMAKNKLATRQTMVILDDYNCDLNMIVDSNGCGAFNLDATLGFGKLWADCKATHGVNKGKSYFEVKIIELIDTSSTEENDQRPSVLRIGWSEQNAAFEAKTGSWSFGYKESKGFIKGDGFCESTTKDDVLGAAVDFDCDPIQISFFKNGEAIGQPSLVTSQSKTCALFPHISLKNCKVRVNFGQRDQAWHPPSEGFTFIMQSPISELIPSLAPPMKKSECELIMMVGLPGCGKTAWAVRQQEEHRDQRYNILGTDLLMDLMSASKNGLEYSEVFQEFSALAEGCYKRLLMIASMRARNYIVDMANVQVSTRAETLRKFHPFIKRALVIQPSKIETEVTSEEEDLNHTKSKAPESVINEMKANFTLPEQSEGFKAIEFVGMKESDAREFIGKCKNNHSSRTPMLTLD